ncbi:MAG TPA: NADH-quinone oxidoreductase subunit L [Elusimicrobia bacterium]|nr:NADH-quinone oxidoreductase subunit L [Elusimicrobiota bacterium]
MQTAALVLFAAPVSALLLGFFVFRRWRPEKTHWPMLLSCAAVTAASLWMCVRIHDGFIPDNVWELPVYRWACAGSFVLEFGLRVDGLSAAVLGMVSLVSTLIHLYAVGYMAEDRSFNRFFLYFHFFFLSMVGLLVADNYLQMYVFWEGVGLASFLLIGFWYEKASARAAAWKAFLTNRIGDLGFMLAVFLLLSSLGTVRFTDVFARLGDLPHGTLYAVAFLLFMGAAAKSAQFPLHVWLPDAMEGPTPVSALMHAATMVTAGVFLMARSMPLLREVPGVLAMIALVGLMTSLGAAAVAATRKDLKRVLAYSTVSQLGLMMVAIGTGNLFGAVFHLITHGFFKALLFLCAGSVIHALHESLNGAPTASVDDAGGLARKLPVTFGAFLIGALALSGIPPLAGFFSKDNILEGVHATGSLGLYLLSLLVAAGSSVYIFRLLFLAFLGERPEQRGPKAHAHEPGFRMKVPILALAVFSAAAGTLGEPLAKMLGAAAPHLDLSISFAALGAAAAGILLAWWAAMRRPSFDWKWRRAQPELERILDDDFGWQSFTAACAGRVAAFSRRLSDSWEKRSWDPFTESLADTAVGLGENLTLLSRGALNEYLWWIVVGASVLAGAVTLCF